MTDIRTSRRFPVHLPFKVLGNHHTPAGSTANISAAGVYLWVDEALEVGAEIEFEMTIPHETIGAEGDVRVHCNGHVVRCDLNQEDGRIGVACVIDRYELLRAEEAGGE